MEKFIQKIKLKYKERCIFREKQWPRCHSNELVRLQLVESENGESYSADFQRGRDDKIVKRTPLSYSDLFKVGKAKKSVRKILVEGDAGIGKTNLSISLSEDWAHEKLFQEFELLLLLPLRHKEVASVGSITDLLKLLHPSYDVCKAVAGYVENEEEKVLIIADGWDELSKSDQQEGSFLYKLLFETFPLMSVIVTSRPSASSLLHRLPCIDRFVEINGFNKESIKEYIESEFTSDQEKASRLLEQLEDNPLVESVCSIPLNSAIICHLWRTLEEDLPSTMTQLYTKIILNVILRNIQKKEAFKNVSSLLDFNHLPKNLQPSFKLLCKFAFQSLENNQIVFSQKMLDEFFSEELTSVLSFGLIQTAETVLETGRGVSLHFILLTFMECLAALYLVQQPKNIQIDTFKLVRKDSATSQRFSMVFRFFFGFTIVYGFKIEPQELSFMFFALVRGSDSNKRILLCFCHCIFEAQHDVVTRELIQLININHSVFRFGRPYTAYDCTAILYVIDKMEEYSSMMIDFSSCGVKEKQIKKLANILASKQGKLQVKRINLSGNSLNGDCVVDLFNRAVASFQHDMKSEIQEDTPTSVNSRGLHLDLSNIPLGLRGLKGLERLIRRNMFSQLVNLALNGSITNVASITREFLSTFFDALSTNCPNLESIGLSQNSFCELGLSVLASKLSRLRQKEILLELEEANLGDEGLRRFVNNLEGLKFHSVSLSNNCILGSGVLFLAEAVMSGQLVILPEGHLYLSNNQFGLERVLDVGKMLTSKHCQPEVVDLSHCNLTIPNDDSKYSVSATDIRQQLCKLPQTCTIVELNLDHTSFTGESINILAGFMFLCCNLENIFCCSCKITSNDLIALLDKLTELKLFSPNLCSKLEYWQLNDNQIDDNGVSSLISHLSSLFPVFGPESISLRYNSITKEMKTKLTANLKKLNCLDSLEDVLSHEEDSEDEQSSSDSSSSSSEDDSSPDDNSETEDSAVILPDQVGMKPVCSDQYVTQESLGDPVICDNNAVNKLGSSSSQQFQSLLVSPTLTSLSSSSQLEALSSSQYSSEPSGQKNLCTSKRCYSSDLDLQPTAVKKLKQEDPLDPSLTQTVSVEKEPGVTPTLSQLQSNDSLTEEDLVFVQKAVWEGRSNWYNLGLELRITAGTLDAIRQTNHHITEDCFRDTLNTWLRSTDLHPSWSSLAKALRAPPVGLDRLTEQLPNFDPST